MYVNTPYMHILGITSSYTIDMEPMCILYCHEKDIYETYVFALSWLSEPPSVSMTATLG